ncbi:hypothetical protein Tco_0710656 [Tanacetum coccineum]
MEVEAPPPIIPVNDEDDFINDEDDVPHDLADSDDEVLANSDDDGKAAIISAVVARGYSGDGADDPPRPRSRQTGLGCRATKGGRRGGRDEGRKGVCKETRNIELNKAVKRYGPQQIKFEWKDQNTMLYIGPNDAWFGNYVGELRDYWKVKAGETRDVEAIRSRPPPNIEQTDLEVQIAFWLNPKNTARAVANA